MSCKHPILAIKEYNKNTKKNMMYFPLGFKPFEVAKNHGKSIEDYYRMFGRDKVVLIPCGQCVSCKLAYSRTWAYRCALEASLYDDNCFLTLTYDDEHLPSDGHVIKRDVQLFIKRLRSKYGDGIRYFGCGEYGSKTHRPHYHLILFNLWPSDAVPAARSNVGQVLLTSDTVSKLWPKGAHMIGDVTIDSCSYVARYCTKKIYGYKDDSFTLMSRRPGIGYGYFMKHKEAIVSTDKVYTSNGYCTMPRYFESLLEKIDPVKLESIKAERLSRNNAVSLDVLNNHGFDTEKNNWIDGERDEDTLKSKKRGF